MTLGVTAHSNILKRRDDIFLPEHLDSFYTLDRFHINGSRILSRSFQVEHFVGEEEEEEKEAASMSVDQEPVGTDAQMQQKTEEDTTDTEELDEDEREGTVEVAMAPMADILNARNRCDNVRLCFFDSRPLLTPSQARLFYGKDSLNMVAVRPIKCGEQIWNTYGDPPNADLLRRYGHIDITPLEQSGLFPYGNSSDDVEIPADLILDVRLSGTGEEQKTRKIEAWLSLDEPEEWVLPLPCRIAHLVW